MRISYNAEADAPYICLIEGALQCRTLRLNEEVALNIGQGETLVGVEVLDFRRTLWQGRLPSVTLENVGREQQS